MFLLPISCIAGEAKWTWPSVKCEFSFFSNKSHSRNVNHIPRTPLISILITGAVSFAHPQEYYQTKEIFLRTIVVEHTFSRKKLQRRPWKFSFFMRKIIWENCCCTTVQHELRRMNGSTHLISIILLKVNHRGRWCL